MRGECIQAIVRGLAVEGLQKRTPRLSRLGQLQHQVGQGPRLSELPQHLVLQHLVFCNVKCWVPDGIERGNGILFRSTLPHKPFKNPRQSSGTRERKILREPAI